MWPVCCFQLWDIRGSHCIQTFTGHESDINSIVVSNIWQKNYSVHESIICAKHCTTVPEVRHDKAKQWLNTKQQNSDSKPYFSFPVLSQWVRVCYRKWWRHLPHVRHPVGPGAERVQPRQHHLRHHERGVQQVRSSSPRRIWRLQL